MRSQNAVGAVGFGAMLSPGLGFLSTAVFVFAS